MALWHEQLTRYNNSRNNAMDPRFAHSRYPNAPKVTRGRIENIRVTQTGPVVEKKHVFHFLMNPSEISLGYNVNTSIDFTDPANNAMTHAPSYRAGLLSVSFEMLLDRSYEVWTGKLKEGVLHDIAQLERVLGMPSSAPSAGDWGSADAAEKRASGGGAMSVTAAMFPGVIVKRPIRILFGGPKAFSFDGYITSLNITLMKFNANMSPTRAGISISAESWGDHEEGSSGGTLPSGGAGGGAGAAPGARPTPGVPQ